MIFSQVSTGAQSSGQVHQILTLRGFFCLYLFVCIYIVHEIHLVCSDYSSERAKTIIFLESETMAVARKSTSGQKAGVTSPED